MLLEFEDYQNEDFMSHVDCGLRKNLKSCYWRIQHILTLSKIPQVHTSFLYFLLLKTHNLSILKQIITQ